MNRVISIYHLVREFYFRQFRNDIRVAFSSHQQRLVSFLGCGAQKSGTSALDNYLRQHKEICLPAKKEIHYFDNEYNFRFHSVDYSKYHSFFDYKPDHKIAGEVTPAYMYWDYAPRRIWEYNPEIKLIILLRNPIQRAYSHWNMNRNKGAEKLSFLEAVNYEAERMKSHLPYQNKKFAYLDRGFYSNQIRRIFRFFPRDQVLIIKSEMLAQEPVNTMEGIFEFLGITPIPVTKETPVHEGVYSRPMEKDEKDFLNHFYQYEIKSIEKLLGWNCLDWLD